MPRIHPKKGPIEALVAQLTEAQRRILRHALDCPSCRPALLAALDPDAEEGPGLGRVLPWRFTERSYGATIDTVLRRLEPRLCVAEREQAEAPALLAELLSHPPERRAERLAGDDRFHSLAFAQLLCEQSQELGFQDGYQSAALAELALAAVDRLDPDLYGARLVEDARAHGWVLLGNARRIVSDLRGADAALSRAESHLARGTGARMERAYLLERKASLRRAQGLFAEAAVLLDRTISIYQRAGELHQAGSTMVNLANLTYRRTGDPEKALEQLRQAAERIDPQADPRLNLQVRHNLIWFLAETGRYLEAQALLAKSGELYRRHGDPALRLRRTWTAGSIARGMGRLEEAADLFRQAREGFIELKVALDAALVSLDLAGVCARLGRTAEVKRLAEEMVPIFRSRDIHRETLAALIVFQEAAAAEQATVGMVDEITRFLRRQSLEK